jgi:hypothetical protein
MVDMLSNMNRSLLVVLGVALLTAGCGAILVNEGTKQESLTDGLRDPASMKAKLDVPPDQMSTGGFEAGTAVSAKLFGSNKGVWNAFSYAGNTVNSPFVVAGGAKGTGMAARISGTLNNKGDGSYPAFSLQGLLKEGGYYDASNFNGIRFYYKCPLSDQSTERRFKIPIAATLPTSAGGTCTDGCYNHFGADLAVSAEWTLKSYSFSDLKRLSGWGSPVNPPDFVDHLSKVVYLQWDHGTGNNAGAFTIDFWVDEVEFF